MDLLKYLKQPPNALVNSYLAFDLAKFAIARRSLTHSLTLI